MDNIYEHSMIMHQIIENRIYKDHSFLRSNFQNIRICDCAIINCDFSRSSLSNLRIENSKFIQCKLINTDLTFSKFTNCIFEDCNFELAELENLNFYKSSLINSQFIGARIANNIFLLTTFKNIDLSGSSTKFNCFEDSLWENGIFGNCTIDYNIAIKCSFHSAKMNIETLGGIWGINKKDLYNITYLSLGRQIAEDTQIIYHNYSEYLLKKRLCLEMFVFNVSFNEENIFTNLNKLLRTIDKRYRNEQYFSPDELKYFYELLKTMRKESRLPLLVLSQILSHFKQLIDNYSFDEDYYERMLLCYNNICLIYNSMLNELLSYNQYSLNNKYLYKVKITFKQKPNQNVIQVFDNLYKYIFDCLPDSKIKFIKEEIGSYVIVLAMALSSLAAFNIGTLLLTGGVKNLIKFRASAEVLFSKKLPKKYYLDVYKRDESEELAKNIISILFSTKISSLPSELRNLSSDGYNTQNIKEISVEEDKTA